MTLVRKRIVLPLIPTDIFQVIRPTQNKDAVLDLTYQQLLSALSEVFSGGGSLILLQTDGVDNGNQNLLNLVEGTNVTITDDGLGNVTIDSTGAGSTILLQTDGVDNVDQAKLNLVPGTSIAITDDGLGNITFDVSGSGLLLQTDGVTNADQTKLNLVPGTNVTLTDDGLGDVTIDVSVIGILLQTDTVNNPDQTKLNLIGGTNVTLTDDGVGNVTIDTTGGGGGVTSVSATVPAPTTPALSVVVTNPTTTPAIDITANGTISQYVRGDASLGTTVTKTSELYNDGDNGTSHFISLEDLPSNLTLYATDVASGISTYTKAVSSLTDPDYNSVAVNIPVGPLTSTSVATACGGIISSANIIVGNPGIFTMSTIGSIRRTAGTAEGVFFYEIYKRTSAGVESFIVISASTNPVSSPIYVEFNAAALFNNGVFTATDRVVIKFYGLRLPGGSNPSFEFQFGGVAPVRTTLPIPLVVTPANGVTSVAALTLGTAGTDLSSTVANPTTTPVITLNVPTASPLNRGVITAAQFTDITAGSAGVVFDGAGGVITTNTIAYVQIPYNGTITGWQIVANALGSCTITVRKGTFSPFPPTTVIVTPILLTSQTASGTGLSIAVSSGDWLSFTISGVSTVAWVNLTIAITKTV